MDPLSITASILTIVGAGGALAKRLDRLLDLRHAPDILHALSNEVTELQNVVQTWDGLARQYQDTSGLPVPAELCETLEKARQNLLALEQLISYELTNTDSRSDLVKLDKSKWIRSDSKIYALQRQIRNDRSSLKNMYARLTLYA